MAITKLESKTEIKNIVTQLYHEMICVEVANDNESLILLEIYSNDISIYKHEVPSGTYNMDIYLDDGNNEIKIIATDNESSKTITGNIEVNIYSYQHDSEPILSNFIANDGKKLHLELDKAKLTYHSPRAGEHIGIAIDQTIASNFFKIVGENSEFYQIDTNNIPIIQGDIIKRPLYVMFDGVRKMYDGTSDITDPFKSFEYDKNYYFVDPTSTQIDYRQSAIVHESSEIKQNYKLIYNMNDFIKDHYEFIDPTKEEIENGAPEDREIDFASFKINVDNMIGYCDSTGNIHFLYNTQLVTQDEVESMEKKGYPKGLYYYIAHANRSHTPTCNDVDINSDKLFGTGIPGATIKIRFNDDSIKYITVDDDGNWSYIIPSNIKLKINENIYVSQIEPNLLESIILKKIIIESLSVYESTTPIVYPINEQDTFVEGEGITGSNVTIIFPDKNNSRKVYVQNNKWRYDFTEEDDNPLVIEQILSLSNATIETNKCRFYLNENNILTTDWTSIDKGLYLQSEIVNNKTIKLYVKYKNILNMQSISFTLPLATDSFVSIKDEKDKAFEKLDIRYNEDLESIIFEGKSGIGFINDSKDICTLVIELNEDITKELSFEFSNIEIIENRIGDNEPALTFYQTEPYKGKSVDVIVGIGKQDQTQAPIINPINEYTELITGEGIPNAIIELKIFDDEGSIIFEKLRFEDDDEYPIVVDANGHWYLNIENVEELYHGNKVECIQYEENKLPSYITTTHINLGEVTPCLTINPLIVNDKYIEGTGIPGAVIQLSCPDIADDDKFLVPEYIIEVNNEGKWIYNLSEYDKTKFTHGLKIVGKQKQLNKRVSGEYYTEVKVQTYDMSIAPIINNIYEGDKQISGKVEWDNKPTPSDPPESYLFIWHNSKFIKKVKVKKNGEWTLNIPSNLDLIEDDIVQITNLESLDGESMVTSTQVTRSNHKRSDTPKINDVTVLSKTISGKGIAGSTIEIFLNDKSITHGLKVDINSNWEYELPKRITLNPDDEIRVIQRSINKVKSKNVVTFVRDKYISNAPTVFPIKETNINITGLGIPNSIITLYYDDNYESNITTKVSTDNTWKIDIENNDLVLSNNTLYFTQIEPDKKESQIVKVPIKLLDRIPVFTVNDWVEKETGNYTISGTGYYIDTNNRGQISVYADDELIIGESIDNTAFLETDSNGKIITKNETSDIPSAKVNSNNKWSINITNAIHQKIKGKTLKFIQTINENYTPSVITISNQIEDASDNNLTERLTYLYDTFNDEYYSNFMWKTNDFNIANGKLYFGPPEYKGTRSYGGVTPTVNSNDCTYRIKIYDSSKATIKGGSVTAGVGATLKTVYVAVDKGEEIVIDLPKTYRGLNSNEMLAFQTKYKITYDASDGQLFVNGIMITNEDQLTSLKKQISPLYKVTLSPNKFLDVEMQIDWPVRETPLFGVVSYYDKKGGSSGKGAWVSPPDEIVNISVVDSKNKLVAQASTDYGFINIPNSKTPEFDSLYDIYKEKKDKNVPVVCTTSRSFDNFTMVSTNKFIFLDDATRLYNHSTDWIQFGMIDSNGNKDEFRIHVTGDTSIEHVTIDKNKNESINDIGNVEILNDKEYTIELSYLKNIFSIKINNKTFNVSNLITSGNRQIYIGSKGIDEHIIDNVHIYYDRPITHQYNWQLELTDDFNEKSFRQWGPVEKNNGTNYPVLFEVSKKDSSNFYLASAYNSKQTETSMLKLCKDFDNKEKLLLNYFKLQFCSFTDFTSNVKDGRPGNFSIGLMDSTNNIQWITFNQNTVTNIGSYPFVNVYDNDYNSKNVINKNKVSYDIQIVVTNKIEVYIKKPTNQYWQYVGSTNLTISDNKEIIVSYNDCTMRLDDFKVYVLPNNKLNVLEESTITNTHLSIPMFDIYPIEGMTDLSGTINISNEKLPDVEDYIKTIHVKVNKKDYIAELNNNEWYVKFDTPLVGDEQIYIYQQDSRIGNSLFVIVNSIIKDMSMPLSICSISEEDDEIKGYALANTIYNDIIISIPNNGSYHVLLNEDEENGYVTWNLPISTNKIKLRNDYEIAVTGYERISRTEKQNTSTIDDLEEISKKPISTSVLVKAKNQSNIPLINSICEYDKKLSGTGLANSKIKIQIPTILYNEDGTIDDYYYPWSYVVDTDDKGKWTFDIPEDAEIISDMPIIFNQYNQSCSDSQDVIMYVREYRPSITPVIKPINDCTTDVTIKSLPNANIYLYFDNNKEIYVNFAKGNETVFHNVNSSYIKNRNKAISYTYEHYHNEVVMGDDVLKDRGYDYITTITKADQLDTPILNPISKETTQITGKGIPGATIWIIAYTNSEVKIDLFTKSCIVDDNGNWIIDVSDTIIDDVIFTIYQTKSEFRNSANITTYASNLYFSNTLAIETPVTDEDTSISGIGLAGATLSIYVNDKLIKDNVKVDTNGKWNYKFTSSQLPLKVDDKITVIQEKEKVNNKEIVETYVTYKENKIIGVNLTKSPTEKQKFDDLKDCENWLLENNQFKWTFELKRSGDKTYTITFNNAEGYEVQDKVFMVYQYQEDKNDVKIYVKEDKEHVNINTKLQDDINLIRINGLSAHFANKNVTNGATPIYIDKMQLCDSYNQTSDLFDKSGNYQLKGYSAFGEIYKRPIQINVTLLNKIYDGSNYIPFIADVPVELIDDGITIINKIDGDDVYVESIYNDHAYNDTIKIPSNEQGEYFKEVGPSWIEYTNPDVGSNKTIANQHFVLQGKDVPNYEFVKTNIISQDDEGNTTGIILARNVTFSINMVRYIRATNKWEIVYEFDNDIKSDNLTLEFTNMNVIVPQVLSNKNISDDINDYNWTKTPNISKFFVGYNFTSDYQFIKNNIIKPISENRNAIYWSNDNRPAEPDTNRMDVNVNINKSYPSGVQLNLNDQYYESENKQYKLYDGQLIKITGLIIHSEHPKKNNYKLLTEESICKIEII